MRAGWDIEALEGVLVGEGIDYRETLERKPGGHGD